MLAQGDAVTGAAQPRHQMITSARAAVGAASSGEDDDEGGAHDGAFNAPGDGEASGEADRVMCSSTRQLSRGQRAALESVQDALRRSVSRLRHSDTEGLSITSSTSPLLHEADAHGAELPLASWLPTVQWWSNPPSPPGSGRGSARGSSLRGYWSSGLCACLTDPQSCLCALFCWPILLGQMGQKVVRTPHLCLCFAIPMLLLGLFLCELQLLSFMKRIIIRASSGDSVVLTLAEELITPDDDDAPQLEPREQQLGAVGRHASSSYEMYPLLERLNHTAPFEGMSSDRVIESSDRTSLSCLLVGGVCMWATLLRTLVRQRDAIPGSPLRDFAITACCFFCGTSQLARHEGLVQGSYGVLSPTGEKVRTQRVLVHPVPDAMAV